MSQRERTDIYVIPPNFAQEGTIFSGRVKARNAAEAAILVFFLLQFLLSLDLSVRGKIYACVIVLIPTAIFAVLGVQGESLTSFVFQFFKYLWNKRAITVPDGRYRLKRNRRLRKVQLRQNSKRGGGQNRKRSQSIKTEVKRSQTYGKAQAEGGAERRKGESEA